MDVTSGTRTAFVTGATSGIGLAVTQSLARQGVRVFGCSRNAENVASMVKQLREDGLDVAGAACDVTAPDQIHDAVAAAASRWGAIDILVNAAGRNGGGETATITDDLWLDVLATNLTGVF
ncbi:MAG TPA: SDR family NAD(P)-dependent oxidoreductase, partial [Catenuloplanes sp.]